MLAAQQIADQRKEPAPPRFVPKLSPSDTPIAGGKAQTTPSSGSGVARLEPTMRRRTESFVTDPAAMSRTPRDPRQHHHVIQRHPGRGIQAQPPPSRVAISQDRTHAPSAGPSPDQSPARRRPPAPPAGPPNPANPRAERAVITSVGQHALARAWAQFWAHSSPSAAVHRWSPGSCLRGSRTVADAGERHATLLESVLGATPQEFESPILRHADLLKHWSYRASATAARVRRPGPVPAPGGGWLAPGRGGG
jgi:hypothetical protein